MVAVEFLTDLNVSPTMAKNKQFTIVNWKFCVNVVEKTNEKKFLKFEILDLERDAIWKINVNIIVVLVNVYI